MFSIIPLVMITTPFVILAGLSVRALGVRRGVADILTGVVGASLGPVGSAVFGPQPMASAEAMAFVGAFPFAGAVGGFVFWRAVGYPGLKKSSARTVERTRSGAEAVSEIAGGSVLGVGLAAHAMLRSDREQETERRPKAHRQVQVGSARKGFGKRTT